MMKKTYILTVAFVLVLVMTGIPYAQCYPSAGTDHMDATTATLWLEIIGIGNETLTATGQTTVTRGDPYNPHDGRMKIDTEIVSMSLTGTSALVGLITIIESPTETSSGAIQQQTAGTDFPADSFFNVSIEIQIMMLEPPFNTFHNDYPVPMNATIHAIPPWGSVYKSPPDEKFVLMDEQDNVTGFIKDVSHKIEVPVGGVWVPVDKLGLLAPYIALASTIIVATAATAIYVKRVKRRKEKQ